ncbi:MAG: peptidoglycan recognition protein family protein [Clostridium sp.]
MLKINKQLININYSKGVTILPKYIVIHDTDNKRRGSNAMANRNYFANHENAKASAHYIVDDNNIIQSLEDTWRGWHVGDNNNYSAITNSNSIGIEICVNEDGDFEKAMSNAIDLARHLLDKHGLGVDALFMHNHASGKYCSRRLLDTGRWQEFKHRISGVTVTPPVIQDTPPSGLRTLAQAKAYVSGRELELQQKLIKAGYQLPRFGADGTFGDETYNVLIRFQREQGLTVDALAGKNTFAKLDSIIATKVVIPSVVLRRGSKGSDVGRAQNLLKAKGYDCGTTDNDFGGKTDKAVRDFQRAHGLSVDGIIGKNTWTALLS